MKKRIIFLFSIFILSFFFVSHVKAGSVGIRYPYVGLSVGGKSYSLGDTVPLGTGYTPATINFHWRSDFYMQELFNAYISVCTNGPSGTFNSYSGQLTFIAEIGSCKINNSYNGSLMVYRFDSNVSSSFDFHTNDNLGEYYILYDMSFSSIYMLYNTFSYGIYFDILSVTIFPQSSTESLDFEASLKTLGLVSTLSNYSSNTTSLLTQTNSKLDGVNSNLNDLKSKQDQTNSKLDEANKKQDEANKKLDDMNNADISSEDKEQPDTSKYDDFKDTEDSLMDIAKQADMGSIDIGIDGNSSSFIWDTLTSFLKSHSSVFGMFIAILSIGIIKLALGR